MHKQKGFTLVELMVAMVIALIVMGGAGAYYLSTKATFRTAEAASTLMENSRAALDAMSYALREAGYMGCASMQAGSVHVISNSVDAVTLQNNGPVYVYAGGNGWTPPSGYAHVAGDVLRTYEASGGGVAVTSNLPATASNIKISGNPYNFQQGQTVMVSNCQGADVFAISSNPNSGTLAFGNNVNNGNKLSQAYDGTPPPGARVYTFYQIDYFVGCPSADYAGGACTVPPALYQSINGGAPQKIADHVENMAFDLGIDTTGTGAASKYVAPAQVTDWTKVVSVQMHLLLVGDTNGGQTDNVTVGTPQTYQFNGASVTASDNRMYREYVQTVALPNAQG